MNIHYMSPRRFPAHDRYQAVPIHGYHVACSDVAFLCDAYRNKADALIRRPVGHERERIREMWGAEDQMIKMDDSDFKGIFMGLLTIHLHRPSFQPHYI